MVITCKTSILSQRKNKTKKSQRKNIKPKRLELQSHRNANEVMVKLGFHFCSGQHPLKALRETNQLMYVFQRVVTENNQNRSIFVHVGSLAWQTISKIN